MFSIVVIEMSTIMFISVPGLVFVGDLMFFQIAFGYVVGCGLVIVVLMLTLF